LWNSKEFTRSRDNRGHTRVRDVPEWRHLDLLRRPEVKQPIAWSAREIELILEERAVDW